MHVAFGVESRSHRNEVGGDVEDIGNYLRGCRFVALALRTRTHRNADLTIDIQDGLQETEMVNSGIGAIGANRTFVRYRLAEIDAGIPEAVDAGKHLRPDHAAQGLITRICAAIINVS